VAETPMHLMPTLRATGFQVDQGRLDVSGHDPNASGAMPDPAWDEVLTLYREVRPRLVVSLFHLLESGQDAEDVVQEAFIQAARKWHTLRNEDAKSVTAWLNKIAVNLAKDKIKQRGRRREVIVSDYESVPQLVSKHLSPEWAYEVSAAFEVLRGLSNRQREVYLLRHYFGLDIQDIAHTIGRRPSTVREQLYRAQERITRKLGRHDGSSSSPTRRD
jgi:RNA polymerase sigma-70 factor, ECF subfamily